MKINTLDIKTIKNDFLIFDNFKTTYPEINTDDVLNFYVYKITDKTNGKIYIGKTKNIHRRASEYINAKSSHKRHRKITDIIIEKGIDNFVMEPIISTRDELELSALEMEYILNTDAMNPDIGYNEDYRSVITPPKLKNYKPRPQTSAEKMGRSKMICAINPSLKLIIFSTGMKLFGDRIFRRKDEVKSAARRTSSLNGFFLYYLNEKDFNTQLAFAKYNIDKGSQNPIYTSFIELSEYIFNYLKYNTNPLNYEIKFIHQADNVEGYEYDDVNEVIVYFKERLQWF